MKLSATQSKAVLLTLIVLIAPLTASALSYLPGATLNPSCLPTDPTCIVVTSASTSTTAGIFNATTTNATSTFAGNVSVAGTVQLGTLSGILKAINGIITTALVNLSSDVTGVLAVINGGTGTTTAPTLGQILVGNGSGGYNLVSTSSLGISGSAGTWGSITGSLSNQTDLWTALTARISSSSLSAITALSNLASVGVITSGTWQGSPITPVYGGTGSTTLSGILVGNGTSSIASLSFSGPLSLAGNVLTLPQSNASSNGFLASSDWTTFSGKLSSSSLATSAALAGIVLDHTGSGALTFATSPTFSGSPTFTGGSLLYSTASTSTIPDNTAGAWSLATSTSGAPIISVSTAGNSTSVSLGVANSDILIGSASTNPNLVFLNPGSIKGYGLGQLLTIGAGGDVVNFGVNTGIGSTSPSARFSIAGSSGATVPLFAISSSSASFSTTTVFLVDQNGNSSIGANGTTLSIAGATTSAASGINIASGCFALAGVCIGSAGGGSSQWTTLGNSIYYNGNVGIGTTSPLALLSLSDNTANPNTTAFLISSSTASATATLLSVSNKGQVFSGSGFSVPSYSFLNDPTTGLGEAAAGQLELLVGGLGVLQVNTGNMFNINQPAGFLFKVSTGGSATTPSLVPRRDDTNAGIGANAPGNVSIISDNAGTGTEVLRVGTTSSDFLVGNVGIGTTSPSNILTLVGSTGLFASTTATSTFNGGGINLVTAAGNTGCFAINGTCISSGGSSASSTLLSDNNTFSGANIFSQPFSLTSTTGTTTISAGQGFNVGNGQLVVQQGSGNVGVGTTTPGATFSISDNTANHNTTAFLISSSTASATTTLMSVSNTGQILSGSGSVAGFAFAGDPTTGTELVTAGQLGLDTGGTRVLQMNTGNMFNPNQPAGFLFKVSTGGSATNPSLVPRRDDVNAGIGGNVAGNISIIADNAGTGVEVLRVGTTSSAFLMGNVAIGTTTPASRLTVWGPDTATTTAFSVVNNASTTAFAVYDNGNATYSGSIFQSSDQRLKNNVMTLDGSTSLSQIMGLTPVSYNRIDQPGTQTNLGFIAQAVAQIFPNLVSTTSPTAFTPDGTLTLNYTGLISPMVAAIQQLSNEIASIEGTLAGFAQSITTNRLCVNKTDGTPVCLTGDQLASLLATSGQKAANQNQSQSTSDTSSTPPVIQINGNNPAVISVGDTYEDQSATILGPQADLNLGISTFVNGSAMSPVVIDTTQAATDTIDYVVTDQNGLTSTSTRTVVIEAPAAQQASTDASSSAATSAAP